MRGGAGLRINVRNRRRPLRSEPLESFVRGKSMKRLAVLAVAAMALGLVSSAHAQQPGFYPGWYVGGGAGPTLMQDPSGSFTPLNIVDPSFKAKMNLGFGVSLSAGYEGLFIPEIRVEQHNIHGLGRQDGRGIGPSGGMGCFEMNPVTPAAGAVQLGQDFAQEQGVFGG